MPVAQPKILFLPKWYPDRNDPQNGIFIRKHAEAVSMYCDVKVLRVARDLEMHSKYRLEKNNSELSELFSYYRPSRSRIAWIKKFKNFLRYYRAFNKGWKELKDQGWEPDLVHVHVMVRPGLMAFLKGWPLAKPYLISEHSSEYINGRFAAHGGFFKALNFRLFWKARAVTAVSQHLANAMKELGLPGNTRVIPNIVDMPELRSSQTNECARLLTVADLVDDLKNISGIIGTVGELLKEGVDLEYHLIGGGPDEEMLKTLARANCPEDRCVFYGRMDNKAVLDNMANADLVVSNSRVETFALVVAEAISLGKPVVATRCGGPEMFVNEETGVLVDIDSAQQLKAGIKEVLSKLHEYDPERMRATLGDRYSRRTVGKQFFELYKEILK